MSYQYNNKKYFYLVLVFSSSSFCNLLYVYGCTSVASAIDLSYKYKNDFYVVKILDIKSKSLLKEKDLSTDVLFDYTEEDL